MTETEAREETPLQEAEDDPVDAASAEEEPETPAPAPERGRPKGSKDAQPRTRTRPPHPPSKQYMVSDSATAMLHLEEVMASARQQEVLRKQDV